MQYLDVLIVDELGFVPFDRTGGELLFHLLADRYGSAVSWSPRISPLLSG
jgi:DNA replication protein DnaC